MKCPKCGYIGFEAAERCRNCGYDFSLAIERTPAAELPLTKGEATSPVVDLPLGPPADAGSASAGQEGTEGRPAAPGPPSAPGPDLPLFASTPRPPLAVRRTPPPATRQHPRTSYPHTPVGGLKLEPQTETHEWAAEAQTRRADAVAAATAGRRVAAAAIDLLILGTLDAGVLYFTLRLCRLAVIEAFILPAAPLLLFFLILNGGYLLAFTSAGGQTIGKMAVGIKVVAADVGPLTLRQAVVRTIGCILCVVPAGIGFVPFLLAPGRRALHDRLAGTWVVRVPAP